MIAWFRADDDLTKKILWKSVIFHSIWCGSRWKILKCYLVCMHYASVATETSQISIQQQQHDWHNSQKCKMHQSGLVKSKASKGGLISEWFSIWLHPPKNVPNHYPELEILNLPLFFKVIHRNLFAADRAQKLSM